MSGQNIFIKASGKPFPKSKGFQFVPAANFWYQQNKFYNRKKMREVIYYPGSGNQDKMAGPFTQLIWAQAKRVGCGVKRWKQGSTYTELVVCNYDRAIEYRGRMYKQGKDKKCPKGQAKGLCIPGIKLY